MTFFVSFARHSFVFSLMGLHDSWSSRTVYFAAIRQGFGRGITDCTLCVNREYAWCRTLARVLYRVCGKIVVCLM